MRKIARRAIALALSLTLIVSTISTGGGMINANAGTLGSLAGKVTGTWSYWDGKTDVVQTNAMLLNKLPTLANKGVTRFTTDNYDSNYGAFKTNGWSTSMGWNFSNAANKNFGNTVYALPLSYIGKSDGMIVTKPPMKVVNNCLQGTNPEDGSLADFKIKSGFTSDNIKVDKESDWSTDVILQNKSDSSQYMKTTMTQGSPFAQFQMYGTTTASLLRTRTGLDSRIVGYNGKTAADSTMLIMQVFDNHDEGDQVSNMDYYAVYVPEGTTWNPNETGTIGEITMNFPSTSKSYFTFAWLSEAYVAGGFNGDTSSAVAEAKAVAESYKDYVFNFVTDTGVTYNYDRTTGTVTTNYNYKYEKKDSSSKDGIIMGVLPSQYKNMTGYNYLSNTARSIRGNIKYIIGNTYTTTLKYSGILAKNTSIAESSKAKLQTYVNSFMNKYGPTATELTKEEKVLVNTYDSGKRMNRAIQVMQAAEECGDTANAEILLQALEKELADWFTCDNENNAEDKYFYYDKGVGSLFGFPQSYYTVDGITDHHFHYGYFIQAAAQVALRDPDFIKQYSWIIDELIEDIACDTKDSGSSKYPYLRSFSTYEGHSWAAGHANFGDGNNQESSSEAINAWAGLILYGQVTGDESLTDLGVYLYATETNAVNNYWFDIDGDILDQIDPVYRQSITSNMTHNQVSMLWGGKLDYAAWWTAEPLQIQGINLLPITSASYYLAKNTDFIKENFEVAQTNESQYTGTDKNVKRWNELWSSYISFADIDKAESYFDDTCDPEAGDSKAHAYAFIESLKKAGSPNLDITSDDPLSMVFQDDDGNVTYAACNTSNTTKTVTFSDGKQIQVQPGQQLEVRGESCTYTVKYYKQNADLTYSIEEIEQKSAPAGRTVKASSKSYSGYILDETASGSKTSGKVTEDGKLVLEVYYRLRTNEDPTEAPTTIKAPNETIDWSTVTDWEPIGTTDISYKVISGSQQFNRINGDPLPSAFYLVFNAGGFSAKITGPDTDNVITKECPGAEINVKASELSKVGYYKVEATVGGTEVVIAIKKGTPSEIESTTKEPSTTKENVTTSSGTLNAPTGVATQVNGNSITVIFNNVDSATGYKLYVDGIYVMPVTNGQVIPISNFTAGEHTFAVTAYNGTTESIQPLGVSVMIPGGDESTTAGSDTTTSEMTTSGDTTAATDVTTKSDNITTSKDTSLSTTYVKDETTGVKTDTKKATVKRAVIKKTKRITKKKAKITVTKMKNIKGYQVKYSTSKSFKKKLTKFRNYKKRVFTIKRLKATKKYYIRVRAYNIVSGEKVYGKWSKRQAVKKK